MSTCLQVRGGRGEQARLHSPICWAARMSRGCLGACKPQKCLLQLLSPRHSCLQTSSVRPPLCYRSPPSLGSFAAEPSATVPRHVSAHLLTGELFVNGHPLPVTSIQVPDHCPGAGPGHPGSGPSAGASAADMFTGLALSDHASAAGLTSVAQRQQSLNQRNLGPIGRSDSPALGQPSGRPQGLSGMPGLPAAANGGLGGLSMPGMLRRLHDAACMMPVWVWLHGLVKIVGDVPACGRCLWRRLSLEGMCASRLARAAVLAGSNQAVVCEF